jgi:hypothetical protein
MLGDALSPPLALVKLKKLAKMRTLIGRIAISVASNCSTSAKYSSYKYIA